MTIGWAIVIVAVLFLLHRYKVLGRATRTVLIIAALLISCGALVLGWNYLEAKWRTERATKQFIESHDCLNPSAGTTRPVSRSGEPWCQPFETVHDKGSPIDMWQIVSDMPTVPPGEYFAINGEKNESGIGSATGARLCVNSSGAQRCYLGGGGEDAKAEEVRLSSGGRLILLESHDSSGDDTFTSIALLANRGGELVDLLPKEVRNPTGYRLWNLPEFSLLPVLVTVHYEWDMTNAEECHACPHRYTVSSYVYSKDVQRYIQAAYFWTDKKYGAGDPIFEEQRSRVIDGLQRSAREDASRHVSIPSGTTAQ